MGHELLSVVLSPAIATLSTGASQQFAASGEWSDGSSTAPTVNYTATGGTITANGLYTAGSTAGTFRIIAVQQGGTQADTSVVTLTTTASQLQAVILTPASVSLETGATQQFSVSAQWSNGSTTAPPVTFSATGGTITVGGLYTAASTPGSFRVIAVQQGGTFADTGTVTVAIGAAPLAGDLRVEANGVPPAQEKWLLEDTDTTKWKGCPSDFVIAFKEAWTPITIPVSGCKTELSIFSVGNAPVLDLAPNPHLAAGQNTITETLPARWKVKLHVVTEYSLPPSDPHSPESEAGLATSVFDANRMGIEFVIDGNITLINPDPLADPLAAAIAAGCSAFQPTSDGPSPYVVESDLNVFYVQSDQWSVSSIYFGYTCVEEGLPGVIFIRQRHVTTTLAHEIGHALSLKHAGATMNYAYYGWPESNLMRTGLWDPDHNPDPNLMVRGFTLGQAYRANFNLGSWLNGSGPRGVNDKACQKIEVNQMPNPPDPNNRPPDWPCPLLQLDWAPP